MNFLKLTLEDLERIMTDQSAAATSESDSRVKMFRSCTETKKL